MTAWHLFWHPRHVVSIISADQRQLPELLGSTKILRRIGLESWICQFCCTSICKFEAWNSRRGRILFKLQMNSSNNSFAGKSSLRFAFKEVSATGKNTRIGSIGSYGVQNLQNLRPMQCSFHILCPTNLDKFGQRFGVQTLGYSFAIFTRY